MPKRYNLARQDDVRRSIEVQQRRKTIMANVLAGATYREIAEAVGLSISAVSKEVKAISKELNIHYLADAERWRLIQLRRYDVMLNALWEDGRGRVVDGKTIPPDKSSIDRIVNIMDRQNRLLGLEKNEPIMNTNIIFTWPDDEAKKSDDVADEEPTNE